jgi:hypothetical protein
MLSNRTNELLEGLFEQNEKLIDQSCYDFMVREFQSIEQKLEQEGYANFLEFQEDLKRFYQFL